MATNKKTTAAATKSKTRNTKKTNSRQKEETGVVNDFLDTVVGGTMNEQDAIDNENRLKERENRKKVRKEKQEEINESTETQINNQEMLINESVNEPNCEPNCELNEGEERFDELFNEEAMDPETTTNTNNEPPIVYVNSAMGAGWD